MDCFVAPLLAMRAKMNPRFLSVMAGHSRPKDGVASARHARPSTSFLLHARKDVDARDI
jgi:hypothetical protein